MLWLPAAATEDSRFRLGSHLQPLRRPARLSRWCICSCSSGRRDSREERHRRPSPVCVPDRRVGRGCPLGVPAVLEPAARCQATHHLRPLGRDTTLAGTRQAPPSDVEAAQGGARAPPPRRSGASASRDDSVSGAEAWEGVLYRQPGTGRSLRQAIVSGALSGRYRGDSRSAVQR
jgi:hypothetical protein